VYKREKAIALLSHPSLPFYHIIYLFSRCIKERRQLQHPTIYIYGNLEMSDKTRNELLNYLWFFKGYKREKGEGGGGVKRAPFNAESG